MALQIGDQAPEFKLQDTEGSYISLSSQLGKGQQVVLLFFPLAFTSTCTEELCTTRDNMKMYDSLGAKIFGISIDSFFVLKEFKKSQNLNFTLLSDFNKEASEAYGVLNQDYFGMQGVSKRAVFVIDSKGLIKHAEVLEDAGQLPDFKSLHQSLD